MLYQIDGRIELGLPPKSKLFSTVIDDYVRFRQRDHAHGRTSEGMLKQIIRVAKFWREYAGVLADLQPPPTGVTALQLSSDF